MAKLTITYLDGHEVVIEVEELEEGGMILTQSGWTIIPPMEKE
jgi:hypothetical protein